MKFDRKRVDLFFDGLFNKYGEIFKFPIMGTGQEIVAVKCPDVMEKVYRETMENPIRTAFFSLQKVRYDTEYFEKKGGLLVE